MKSFLEQIGLPQYAEAFAENDVDLSVGPELTADDLKEIGITSLGHRKKLLKAFAEIEIETGADDTEHAADELRAERREVTTVFADLTGYTQLSRTLETEDLHQVLSALFDKFNAIVRRMGGTIERHIGDCVMAVFGAPVSYGNDAERALRTTLELHRAMEDISRQFGMDLSVHIGAAAGNVLFARKGYGERESEDFTLTGDTVNLASRLADQAKGSETLIDDRIFVAFSHQIECDAPSTLEVKGFEHPVLAHRFIGFRETVERRPMVGRRDEMAVFRTALDGCIATGSGETIYVCADAGLGKSRLLQEVTSLAAADGFKCHSSLILDFGSGDPQSPLNMLVSSLCGLGENAQGSAVRATVARLTEDGTLDETAALFLTVMLGGALNQSKSAMLNAMNDAARLDGQRRTLRRLIQRFSKDHPLLIKLEDLHWADPAVLPGIQVLVEESRNNPVLVVISSRLEGPVNAMQLASIESTAKVRRMDLKPLSATDAVALASSMIRPSDAMMRACVERAQGNPLFLEQLLRHANDNDGAIPGSIQSLIQARFDRLEPADRRILQAAAILGQRFTMTSVTQIANIEVYDESTLINATLIRPIEEGFLFAHALIRDAVLRTITRDDLRSLHRSAAEWYAGRDPTLHAEHLGAAHDPQAAEAYLVAARDAQAKYRNDEALAIAQKGLDRDPRPQTMVKLLCIKGHMLREAGKSDEAIAAFELAQESATDARDLCRAQIGVVATMRIQDRIDEAYALLDVAQELAESRELLAELSEIHYFRGSLHFPRGNLDGCLADHAKSLDYAKRADLPERQALALSGLGDAYYARGRMFTAHSVIEECLELCDEHALGAVECANRFMLATAKIYMNQTPQALNEALRSAELAAQVGLARPEIVSRLTAGWVLTSMARYEQARGEVLRGLALADQLGAKRFEPFLEEVLARIEAAEGHPEKAAQIAEGALTKVHEVGAQSFIGPWVMSTVALTTPDAARRHAVLAEGAALLEKGCVGHNYFRFYQNAMQACLNAHEWDDAARFADALAAYTAKEPTPWSDFYIERTRVLVAAGRGSDQTAAIAAIHQRAREASLLNALPEHNQAIADQAADTPVN
ncbi:Adenylate/guanylate cyclase [Sulfitobacter noctilucae]|uniref:adenylate/guanylate cyclase domain-containing protein n=1 Tax=Sulfitobacter noctilucae TaxID=1342302 RepID=UPI00046811C9|nr:adenylate/guanylate cyclase domain-containing protein [Sulfitobacter noctilucae]KIN61587.1 Adenylate/guanylate cyclase [Sulfitobacter noctilucae]